MTFPAGEVLRTSEAETEEIGEIYGQTPDSKEEWWIAVALWKYGHTFEYQVRFFGGYALRGGQVLDFLVTSTPTPTPLIPMEEYWHPGLLNSEDSFKMIQLQAELGGVIPVIWFGKDMPTREAVDELVFKHFGYGANR